jgi:transposase-like protein
MRLDDRFYKVNSQSGNGMYNVIKKKESSGWLCDCPDHVHRNVQCKHIWAVQFSLRIREQVQARVIEPITDIHACLFCKSESIIKWGLRHNKYGDIQRFSCKSCGKSFTVNLGFERMKHNPQAITTAMQLYFSGESLRNTARSLRLIGAQVSHQTIYRWITRYTELMQKYLDKITPQVSDTWATDELFLKIKGNMKYLYAMMDEQTRFWIAQEVGDTKFTEDIRPLFQLAKAVAGKAPKTLVSDGAANFHEAYNQEFRTLKLETRTEHIRHIRLQGDHNNNRMERMNGEIRDREKVMRGLERKDSPILTGYQLFHNYIRPHKALDYKTPAEVAGIEVKGRDKWLTLIQNARRASFTV